MSRRRAEEVEDGAAGPRTGGTSPGASPGPGSCWPPTTELRLLTGVLRHQEAAGESSGRFPSWTWTPWRHSPKASPAAVRIVREKGKPAQVARDLGIHEGTLGNWVANDRAERGEKESLTGDERAHLRTSSGVAELRMERDVRKVRREALCRIPD